MAGREFRIIADDCKVVADELLAVLEEPKVEGPRKKWASFTVALKGVRRKG